MELTPTPWESHNDIDGSEILFSGDITIGRIYTGENAGQRGSGKFPSWEEGIGNSEMIKHCVNLYPELVAALERVLAYIEADEESHGRKFGVGNECREVLNKCNL